MAEYIYLIKEREFIKTNEEIFKIGKTKQQNSERIKSYPKGSVLLIQMKCIDCDKTEKLLIDKFKKKYKLRSDIGAEYFEGTVEYMIRDIIDSILTEYYRPLQNITSLQKIETSQNVDTNGLFIYDFTQKIDDEFFGVCSKIDA